MAKSLPMQVRVEIVEVDARDAATHALLRQLIDEQRRGFDLLYQLLRPAFGLDPLTKPTLKAIGVDPMTGDLIFKLVFAACDPRTQNRHVKVSLADGTVLAEGDLAGADAAEFADPALMAAKDSVLTVDVASSADGLQGAAASFNLPLTDNRPLAASGAPTVQVTGIAE